jgi:hypothetical protein
MVGRGVPSPVVRRSDLQCALHVRTQQAIDDRRFSDTGGSISTTVFRSHVGRELIEPFTGDRCQDVNSLPQGRCNFGRSSPRIRTEVCIVEHDNGSGPAFPDRAEVTLKPAEIQIGIERSHDEGDIDVRHKDLLGRTLSGNLAGKLCPAGENFMDERFVFGSQNACRNPVTYSRKRGPVLRSVTQMPHDLSGHLTSLGHNTIGFLLFLGNAGRRQALAS